MRMFLLLVTELWVWEQFWRLWDKLLECWSVFCFCLLYLFCMNCIVLQRFLYCYIAFCAIVVFSGLLIQGKCIVIQGRNKNQHKPRHACSEVILTKFSRIYFQVTLHKISTYVLEDRNTHMQLFWTPHNLDAVILLMCISHFLKVVPRPV